MCGSGCRRISDEGCVGYSIHLDSVAKLNLLLCPTGVDLPERIFDKRQC